jgi:hypothetical protein
VKIQMWSVDRVLPYKKNPRRNGDACSHEYREVFAFWIPPAFNRTAADALPPPGLLPAEG